MINQNLYVSCQDTGQAHFSLLCKQKLFLCYLLIAEWKILYMYLKKNWEVTRLLFDCVESEIANRIKLL